MKVLVVDDNQIDRRRIARMLRTVDSDAETLEASGFATAMKLADQETFDGFVIDYLLPGFSGARIVRALRGMPRYAQAPIIVLSGHAVFDQESMNAGASCFLDKGDLRPHLLCEALATAS